MSEKYKSFKFSIVDELNDSIDEYMKKYYPEYEIINIILLKYDVNYEIYRVFIKKLSE